MRLNQQDFEFARKELLDSYKCKQSFRVAIGKTTWIPYETFNPSYNLREILNDEVVIEFDTDRETSLMATHLTGINLYKANIVFQVWDHDGRSPHIHIYDLPIADLEPDKKALFKKLFIRKYVPQEYIKFVDMSLTNVHLVRLEYSPCWKGKFDVKKLLYEFNPIKNANEAKMFSIEPEKT